MNSQDEKRIQSISKTIDLIKKFVKYDESVDKLNIIEEQTKAQDFWDDQDSAAKIMQEKDRLQSMVSPVSTLHNNLIDLIAIYEMLDSEPDEEMLLQCSENLEDLEKLAYKLQIESILCNKHDNCNCFVEINAGAGGTEAQDWVGMLARMYCRWAEKRGYKIDIIDQNNGEEAGIKSISILLKGDKAFGWLKKETGVHRLVRISPFDSNARRHTSFASVFVSPEINQEIKIEINQSDLRIDTYRASGAGGQHVNKTDSAIRITHLPTGIVTQSQTDRSQHRNKEIAMNMLKAKLYAIKLNEQKNSTQLDSKTDISWGNQIRSYVLQPYQIVKDLRTNVERGDAMRVLDGDIDCYLESAIALLCQREDEEQYR